VALLPLEGHEDLRRSLAGAWHRRRLPPVLLLHGSPGVGKQRLGHWLGQLLVCTQVDRDTGPGASPRLEPCGSCRECGLALRLEHPDLHWYVPVPRPRTRGSRDRDDEALEDARRGWLEESRANPLRATHSSEVRALHLGTIRNLRKEAQRGRGTGPRRLFLLADAEELVAQEASQEAANALLKLLEEPPADTWFVLTSSEPGRLLPTIRSRATALYVPALPAARVQAFLVEPGGAAPEAAERAALLSGGSIGRALGFLPEDAEDGPLEQTRKSALRLVHAALSPRDAEAYLEALGFKPSGARGLMELLAFVELWLRDLGAAASGVEGVIRNRDAESWLVRKAKERGVHPAGPSRALAAVERAREEASGNVNPQLLLAGLILEMRDALVAPGSGHPPGA
jgi:DNA polymerase III subunit delta'